MEPWIIDANRDPDIALRVRQVAREVGSYGYNVWDMIGRPERFDVAEHALRLPYAEGVTVAGEGDDVVFGGGWKVWGLGGDDVIFQEYWTRLALGGAGNDFIAGTAGHDTMAGSDGDDTLVGGSGNDSLFGGSGSNLLLGGFGDDRLDVTTNSLWVGLEPGTGTTRPGSPRSAWRTTSYTAARATTG